MGCALAADLVPEAAAVFPLVFTVSADLIAPTDPRSSVSVRLLGVAVGVLDANKPRGTCCDAAFVVETGGERLNR